MVFFSVGLGRNGLREEIELWIKVKGSSRFLCVFWCNWWIWGLGWVF